MMLVMMKQKFNESFQKEEFCRTLDNIRTFNLHGIKKVVNRTLSTETINKRKHFLKTGYMVMEKIEVLGRMKVRGGLKWVISKFLQVPRFFPLRHLF